MSSKPVHLIFDDMSKPVRVQDCDALLENIPLVFPGWSIRRVTDTQQSPVLSLSRKDDTYVLRGDWITQPITRTTMVDAICALVAELIRAYVGEHDDLLCLHGAAANFHGKLVIFPNKYRAGKSTLSACLAAAGVQLFCDDVLPISMEAGQGVAPGLAMRLRRPLAENLTPASLGFIERHNRLQGENYLYLDLADDLMAARGRQLSIGAFVLLEREPGVTTVLEEISEAEVLQQVVWQNFAREAEAPRILEVLSRLVVASQRFRLRYDSAEDAAWLLQQAFDHWPDQSFETAASEVLAAGQNTCDAELAPGHYRRNPEIKIMQLDEQSFLADQQGAAIHHLNPIGSAIWTLLAQPMSREEIIEVLLTAFPDIDVDQVRRDVDNLVGELMRKNLLQSGSN